MDLKVINIMTPNGILESRVIKHFNYNGRIYVIITETRRSESYSVTDLLTGLAVCFGNNKTLIVKEAKRRLNLPAAKSYDYSKHEIINQIQ